MVELTQAIVKELLDYNPETGALIWRERDVKFFYHLGNKRAVWQTKICIMRITEGIDLMLYKFQELEIKVNNQLYLIDGKFTIEEDLVVTDEILAENFECTRVYCLETEKYVPYDFWPFNEIEEQFMYHFYKPDSAIYDAALQFWVDFK